MRIKDTDHRKRVWNWLKDATGERTKSGAVDTAAAFYLKMAGGTGHSPNGAFVELMETAEEEGSLTASEIAEVLDTDELPVEAETSWNVGNQED